MKKVVLFVALMLVAFSGTAMAQIIASDPPAWWDSFDFRDSKAITVIGEGGTGSGQGTYSVTLENIANPDKYKEVYFVLEWEALSDEDQDMSVSQLVTIDWPGNGDPVAMILNPDGTTQPFHREYEFTIRPQPGFETVAISYTGVDDLDQLKLTYDLRTKCFGDGQVAEPASLLLLVGGLAGIARRKRS